MVDIVVVMVQIYVLLPYVLYMVVYLSEIKSESGVARPVCIPFGVVSAMLYTHVNIHEIQSSLACTFRETIFSTFSHGQWYQNENAVHMSEKGPLLLWLVCLEICYDDIVIVVIAECDIFVHIIMYNISACSYHTTRTISLVLLSNTVLIVPLVESLSLFLSSLLKCAYFYIRLRRNCWVLKNKRRWLG